MKTIVIYFSYTNNTKKIAEAIKEKLNCDILEIKSMVPYSDDYQTVVEEIENNLQMKETPEIENININFDNYEKIILGTPVWWYTITPPIRTFLTKYDLSDKKVYPFATNAGWLGKTFNEIKRLCPKSKVENEMSIVFESYSDKLKTEKKDIDNWINKMEKEN